ncbi:MAG: DUF305 domain-containing protein [Halomonas sp.]|nr:DUF305 domain-containing protein [Halomonas sp.]MCC5882020.1 DUF305 domain-containing protein [Halomonas sp.]
MSHTLAVRPFSALALILAGSALLAAPALASEEEAQAQEQIEQVEPAEAEEQQGQDADDDAEAANGDETETHAGHHDHAEHDDDDHAHGAHEPDEHADNEAVQAYRDVNRRMHEDMSIDFTGNPDADFARGMIPHHQGAIDMANVVLMHGEDEAIRDLAREIIEAQEEEIAFLRDWLAKHGYDEEETTAE